MTEMKKAVVREAALFALFLAIATVITWPLVLNLGTALSDLGDPILNAWILDWDLHALSHNPLRLFDAPIYVPAIYPLAYSENLLGIALLMAPLRVAGVTPIALHNIAMLLGLALSGYGTSVLVRTIGRSRFSSIVAGILFAFCPFMFEHLAHVQIFWSGWLPLTFAALFAYWRRPTLTGATLLAAAFLMNGLSNIHWLLFGGFTLFATVVFLASVQPQRGGRFWLQLCGALAVAGLLLLPILAPYLVVAEHYGMRRNLFEVADGSATLSDWLVAPPRSLLYWRLTPDNDRPERRLFPGLMPIALLIAALLFAPPRGNPTEWSEKRRRSAAILHAFDAAIILCGLASYVGAISSKFPVSLLGWKPLTIEHFATPFAWMVLLVFVRLSLQLPRALANENRTVLRDLLARSRFTTEEWSSALWIGIGVFGSLGINSFLHPFLFQRVGAFQSIRTPARWAIIAYLGLAVWSAIGIDALLEKRRRFGRAAVASLIAILALANVAVRTRWEHVVPTPAPVYKWLAREHVRGPVLELPMSGSDLPFPYLLGSMAHHVPIMNGTSGFEPPLHATLRTMTERKQYNNAFTALLEGSRCQLIVVHADSLSAQQQAAFAWLQEGLATGRLALVRRLDHGMSGDYVFALARVGSDWQRLVRRGERDGAGFTDEDNLARLFAGKATYNETTFGLVGPPEPEQETSGPLTVRGWALSPEGVSRVVVRVHSGKYLYQARLEPRPDVSARFPWYPKTPRAGFVATLPNRPKGLPRLTEVQVEITDGRGNVTRFPDCLVTWH